MNVRDGVKQRAKDLREVLTELDQLIGKPRLSELAGMELATFAVGFDAAVKRVESAGSPYAEFNRVLAQRIREAYEGPMGRLAAGPEAVARVIERAIGAERPGTRYVVTFAARFLMALKADLEKVS